MKSIALLFAFILVHHGFSQSENLVPNKAISVFSINNVNLLQKVSLEDLIQYDFMEEVQQEIFDGSTSGKTLKDTGIDYDQKINVFFGKLEKYTMSGFSFGVSDRDQLFEVFDDYDPEKSDYANVEFYYSYINHMALRNNQGILFRIQPNYEYVDKITDSIWYSRGNSNPWIYNYEIENGEFNTVDTNEIEFFDEMEIEEHTATPIDKELPVASEDPGSKTYFELRDSVDHALQQNFFNEFCDDLFTANNTLINNSNEFKSQMASDAEGTFYFNNAENISRDYELWRLKVRHPAFYSEVKELYEGNVFLGELRINDNDVTLSVDTHYGDKLGSIYSKLANAKFDKNVLNYIHKDNDAFFTYNINVKEGYEQAFDVLIPMLEKEKHRDFAAIQLALEMYDEFLNKDAIFDTYKGSVFGSYNGIKAVKTMKVTYEYDEENFDYIEVETEGEEQMPLFSFGITSDREDVAQKVMKFLTKVDDNCRKEEGYWVYDQAILNAAPLYILVRNNLILFTNDENIALNHQDGFGKESVKKQFKKKIKNNGITYGYANLSTAFENIPREFFGKEENEMLDVLRGKSGTVEIRSTKSTTEKTSIELVYNFEGEYDSSSTYILDLINSLYVIAK